MAIETSLHAELQRKAKDHLWLHFSSMGAYRDDEIPIIERGEGPYLFDTHGKRYLDMLSGLFTVQIGYSYGEELGQAALEQMRQLPYYTNWTFAHPPAIELAAKLAELAPPSINRAFFVSGGSEAVESAWKLARQYHAANGQPMRRKVIARKIAYHGTTMGALSITGITAIRTPFEPLIAGVRHVANTNRYRCKYCAEAGECTLACADEVAETIEFEGPETVAMVIMEPVQNSGGDVHAAPRLPPPRARDLRRLRRPAGRRRGDLRLRPARRVVRLPALRLPARPDHVREGPDERLRAARRAAHLRPRGRAVRRGRRVLPARHHVRRPSDGDRGRAAQPRDHGARGPARQRARNEAYLAEQLHGLTGDHEIIGDVRGAGYFMSLELVKDRATRETFTAEECQVLLREFLSPQLQEAGVICRADDRGDPVIQLSPPLICTREHIDEAVRALDEVLPRAQKLMRGE